MPGIRVSIASDSKTIPEAKRDRKLSLSAIQNQLRSVNAAFDPAKAHLPGLLLSDTGKPSIAGAFASDKTDKKDKHRD
jgi:hypothetical protein